MGCERDVEHTVIPKSSSPTRVDFEKATSTGLGRTGRGLFG